MVLFLLLRYHYICPYKEILGFLFLYRKTADITKYAIVYILIRYTKKIEKRGENREKW